MPTEVLAAELTWTGERFERSVEVAVDGGVVAAVGKLGLAAARALPGRALLPGLVNAHSHAFQRGLRGRGERFPTGAGSFWSWRQAMYELVLGLDGERFQEISRQAFREMLAAGITTVGEFHYLHHAGDGADWELDERLRAAAREAGIRLVLLQTCYRSGGIREPLSGAQRRFGSPSLDAYLTQLERLAADLDPRRESLGVAAHSVRAVPPGEMAALHAEAEHRGLVFHLHLEEQRREIDACLAAYGQRPMALLLDTLAVSPTVTAVHCTHSDPDDLKRYLATGGRVALCPLTEANLGDGIADLPAVLAAAEGPCLGTDSNARISMTEEARWLEYVQRLHRRERGVCRDAAGRVGPRLLDAATRGGARSLGLDAGVIAAGHLADFLTLDLEVPALAGWSDDTLLDAFLLGAGEAAVAEVCVGGRWMEVR